MQRSLVFALILALVAVLGAIWFLSRGTTLPPPPPVSTAPQPAAADPAAANAAATAARDATALATDRQMVGARPTALLDDPEILAGLTGWKGRVVDHEKTPVAGCGVRLYRGALDAVVVEGLDIFADEPDFAPQYVAGDTKTAEDGTFEINGVWPRAFYILFAGIGTDAPMHQLVTRVPSPGEVVDLGDIVLPNAGVITGVVVDEDGEPLAGALVRAADLPGTIAGFFPLERFDPQGAVLVREQSSPMKVVEMPKWVKPAFDDLPIPSTKTDAEGAFRLVGVVPGSNLLATTFPGFLSDMKPSIQVRAGQVKDAGRIKLRRGEELTGRVLDTAGKPVVGAEVLAGSTLSVAPVDLAQRIGTTDADGRFQAQGFMPGKVTVAARRGKGHTWVLAEPQPILSDVIVTLPASFAVAVSVVLADGKPAKEPRFRLLQGKAGDGAAEMHLLGFVPPIDLASRQTFVADGQWRIENLAAGPYTLVADAPGHATAFAVFEIATADVAVNLNLAAPKVFNVRVIGHDEKPIRNARVFAEARGKRLQEMPVHCGHTDPDGRLVIDKLEGDLLRVSAEHPRWGAVHGEAKLVEELVLRMQAPGSLRGTLLENGQPPEPGKFSIALIRQRGDGPRGPLEEMPGLLSAGLDGAFGVAALQPGKYQLVAIKSLEALRSPGGVMGMAQDMFMWGDRKEVEVEVLAGQEASVVLDAGEEPIVGPTGTIAGSVTVDGKLGKGCTVSAYANGRRFGAVVDERGRFDLGAMPIGNVWLRIQNVGDGGMFMGMGGSSNLWSGNMELKAAEAKELTIDVMLSRISGTCYLPDGSPAAGVHVQAQGKLKMLGEESGDAWLGTSTNDQGEFVFAQVAQGTWTLSVDGGRRREQPVRGRLEGIAVSSGLPVEGLRFQLAKAIVVKGRVDLAAFGSAPPRWVWVGFYAIKPDTPSGQRGEHVSGVGIESGSGEFSTDDLVPGRYRVRIHAQTEEEESQEYEGQDIDVPDGGRTDLLLRPGKLVR